MYKKNNEPMEGDTIVVWFSSGAASAEAVFQTIERYGDYCNIRVVNNPVMEECSDNRRFLEDVSNLIDVEIEYATNPDYPSTSCVDVWDKRKFMSGPKGAPCTLELKKNARKHWESENSHDWLVLGFTSEEQHRYDRFAKFERENVLPVLIDSKSTKGYCYASVIGRGLQLPKVYSQGYPNANCIGCVKASSPTYWNHVRKHHPEVFEQRAEQSRRLGSKLVLVNCKRTYLDELDPNKQGRPLKGMDFECGIFCGTEK